MYAYYVCTCTDMLSCAEIKLIIVYCVKKEMDCVFRLICV